MENFEKWPLLSRVDSPADLKRLPEKQLDSLAAEIRDYLVFRVAHADRQADAMDGNHADVEQGHVQHRGGAQAA